MNKYYFNFRVVRTVQCTVYYNCTVGYYIIRVPRYFIKNYSKIYILSEYSKEQFIGVPDQPAQNLF